jgi:hypothetical protein
MNFHGTTPVSFDLSVFKQTSLRKLYLALALISAATIQTACSATISGSESISASSPDAANNVEPVDGANDASPAATTAPTDHATDDTTDDSGAVIPPLGTFDRLDPDFIRYQPCLEMPDEFLAEAGLYGKEMMDGVGEVDGVCSFSTKPEHGQGVYKLVGSSFDFEAYKRIPGSIAWDETRQGTPILHHRGEHLADSSCRALVETERGTLGTVFQSFEYGNESYQYDHCEEASLLLKTLLELDQENEH